MKKLNKKRKIVVFIAVLLITVILAIVITTNIVTNQNIESEGYAATANASSTLVANYIKKGITIGGITGTLETLDTSDANATPEDIAWGETAYVKGEKITGTYLPRVYGVPIPIGFYYVGGTKTDGLVISDSKSDENKYQGQAEVPADNLSGNQFVWIPVENIDDFKLYHGYQSGALQDIIGTEPYEGYSGETEDFNLMKQSVEKFKGFYVARFEASEENGKVASKKGIIPINRINWGDSMTNIGTTGAVARARSMYTDKTQYTVTSTLIYGTQWDAIMSFIDPNYKTGTCSSDSFVFDSTGKRYMGGSFATCGSSDNYRVKNIYDLSGNVSEWTMEYYSNDGNAARITRGGSISSIGYFTPASYRNEYDRNTGISGIGFRVALYLDLNAS